jgi:hypothetical protein
VKKSVSKPSPRSKSNPTTAVVPTVMEIISKPKAEMITKPTPVIITKPKAGIKLNPLGVIIADLGEAKLKEAIAAEAKAKPPKSKAEPQGSAAPTPAVKLSDGEKAKLPGGLQVWLAARAAAKANGTWVEPPKKVKAPKPAAQEPKAAVQEPPARTFVMAAGKPMQEVPASALHFSTTANLPPELQALLAQAAAIVAAAEKGGAK